MLLIGILIIYKTIETMKYYLGIMNSYMGTALVATAD
jgi:hypothetical protein